MLRNHGEHTDWPRMRRVSQLGKLCSPKDVATKEHAKFEVECQPPCCGICRVDNLRRLPATGLRQKVQAPVAAEGAGNVSPGGCVTQRSTSWAGKMGASSRTCSEDFGLGRC